MTSQPSDYQRQQELLVEEIRTQLQRGSYGGTTVDRMAEYETDPAICLTSTTSLPSEFAKEIVREIISPLRMIQPGHYYYSLEQLHVTIKNVRVVHYPPRFSESDVDICRKVFARTVPKYVSYGFNLKGLLSFPASLAIVCYADEVHGKLVPELDRELKREGIADDKAYVSDSVFFGNVTVCRLTEAPLPEFLAYVEGLRDCMFGRFTVKSIDLMSCNAVYKSRNVWGTYRLRAGRTRPRRSAVPF